MHPRNCALVPIHVSAPTLSTEEHHILRQCCKVINALWTLNNGVKVAAMLAPLSRECIRLALAQVYLKRGRRVEFCEALTPGFYWVNVSKNTNL